MSPSFSEDHAVFSLLRGSSGWGRGGAESGRGLEARVSRADLEDAAADAGSSRAESPWRQDNRKQILARRVSNAVRRTTWLCAVAKETPPTSPFFACRLWSCRCLPSPSQRSCGPGSIPAGIGLPLFGEGLRPGGGGQATLGCSRGESPRGNLKRIPLGAFSFVIPLNGRQCFNRPLPGESTSCARHYVVGKPSPHEEHQTRGSAVSLTPYSLFD